MFVFKAAVVGAGTMGGQIAQTIAAAGIPVVLKDIDDALVQAGLDEARNVTQGQVGKARRARQDHGRAGRGADRRDPRAHPGHDLLRGLRRGRLRGRGGARADGDQAGVFAELDAATPGHAILASNTSSLSITEIGEATLRPEKVIGFHYFYPASIMPLIEIVEGEDTSAETVARGGHLRPGDPQAADHLHRGAGLRGQPHPQLRASRRCGASRRRRGCRSS